MELACSQERGIFLRTSSSRSSQERKQVVTMDSGPRVGIHLSRIFATEGIHLLILEAFRRVDFRYHQREDQYLDPKS